jgi:putative ABC transport system permease protein
MLKIALRGVREHLVKFLLSVLAVTLGVAFVTGTLSLRQMMSSTFSDLVSTSDNAQAYVQPKDASGSTVGAASSGTIDQVPLALAEQLASIDGVHAAIADVQGPLTLVGANGTAVRNGRAPGIGIGYNSADPSHGTLTGRLPTAPGEITIEKAAFDQSGLKIGDTTKVLIAGQVQEVTVVGSLDMGSSMAGATVVIIDWNTAVAAYASTGSVASIAVYSDPAAHLSERQLVDRISPTVTNAGAEAVTGQQFRDNEIAAINKALSFVSVFLMVFAGLALFIGAFIIANTFTMTVRQQLREYAMLRAVGASTLQVFSTIVIQSLVIGLIGSVLGIFGGLGLVSLLQAFFSSRGMQLSGSVPLDTATVITGLVIGSIVTVVSAVLPAWRAARIAPVEAMREEMSSREGSMLWRKILGGVMVIVGAAGAWWAAEHPKAPNVAVDLGVAAAAVVLGVLVLGPVLVPGVVRVIAWPFVVAIRPLGRLARGNVTRNPKRTANTAGALTIGMALVGAATVLAATTQASVANLVDKQVTADFVASTGTLENVPAQFVQEAAQVPGVKGAYPIAYSNAVIGESAGVDQARQNLIGLDPDTFDGAIKPTSSSTNPRTVLAAGDAVVDASLAKKNHWKIGDQLSLKVASGTTTVRIGGTIDSNLIDPGVVISLKQLDQMVPSANQKVQTVLVVDKPNADTAAVRSGLVKAAKPYYVVSIMNGQEFIDSVANQVQQLLIVIYALLGLSIIISVLGIVNTLALSVIERTREIGLLRAVGLGRLQLAATVTIESVLTAVTGTAVGLVVGVGLAVAMTRVYKNDGLGTLVVPWASLGEMVLLAVVIGVFAALWPGIRAARLKVLNAIATE